MWTAENKIMTLPTHLVIHALFVFKKGLLKFLKKKAIYSTRYNVHNPWLNNVLWILTKMIMILDMTKPSQMNGMLPVVTPNRMSLDANALPKTI